MQEHNQVIEVLLMLYVVIILFNIIVSALLYKLSQHRLFVAVILVWISGLLNFFLQSIYQQFDWKMYLSFCVGCLTSWSYLYFVESLLKKKNQKVKILGLSLGLMSLGLILLFEGYSYMAASTAAALGCVLPTFVAIYSLWRSSQDWKYRSLAILLSFHAIHFLDYPVLRQSELGSLMGFSVALILVFMFSAFLPGFILVEISEEAREELKAQVAARTQSLSEALDQNRVLVNILSHDLATPMTVIGFFFSHLKEERPEVLEMSQAVRARKSFDSILEMLQKVKTLQKFGFSKENFSMTRFDVVGAVEEVRTMLKELLVAKRLRLVISSPQGKGMQVYGDRRVFIHQVLLNLVNNAVKFSYPGDEILIEFELQEQAVRIKVVDFGIGIAPQMLEFVFELNKAKVREGTLHEPGYGLGLHTAHRCMKVMGGDLLVSSQMDEVLKKNRTEFSVIIPLASSFN